MGRVDGKVALVTGGARGTGEQVARLFVAEGARVVIGDVLAEADWARAVERTLARFGRLDVLVNNAGVLAMKPLEETTLADFERHVRVNQIGPFLGMRAAASVMREGGGGSIVNVSSVDGLGAKPNIVAYAATKWALRGMTRVAALELGRHGVIPYQRKREPIELVRDVARMILFLASDESLSCTGADFPVDAGWTAGRLSQKA